jgi:hypothetical protein
MVEQALGGREENHETLLDQVFEVARAGWEVAVLAVGPDSTDIRTFRGRNRENTRGRSQCRSCVSPVIQLAVSP